MATVEIPRILQSECGGKSVIRVNGATVRAVLDEIQRDFPSLYRSICDETGALRQHLHLFVNNALLKDRNNLDTRLESGDVVSVYQAVSGG